MCPNIQCDVFGRKILESNKQGLRMRGNKVDKHMLHPVSCQNDA